MTDDSHPSRKPWPTYARLCTVSLVAAGVFLLVAAWPAQQFGGPAGVWALLVGTGVAWLGSLVAAAPPSLMLGRPPRELGFGLLAGVVLRFFATLVFGLGVWGLQVAPGDAVLIWVGIAQLVLLAVDSTAQIRVVRAVTENPPAAPLPTTVEASC